MIEPKVEIQEYLDRLIRDFIYLKSLYRQIVLFLDWLKTNGDEGIKHSSHFFYLFFYSSKRTVSLNTYKLVSNREKRGINDWLTKARENYKALLPSVYIGWSDELQSERKVISEKEYREIIDEHFSMLAEHEKIINNLTALRDKGFAHSDKKYFSDPSLLEKDYPINWIELESLYKTIAVVLRKHHSFINHSDISMELVTGSDIDTILNRSRGFERFWRNKELNKLLIKKYVFLRDEYDEEDIYLK